MVTLITTITALIATYLLLFKTGWCMTHLYLFGMRKYTSSPEYYKPLRMCDLALVFHNLKMVIFAIFLITLDLGLISNPLIIYGYIITLLICDGFIHSIMIYGRIFSLKNIIKNQWNTQTKISETNDDEVRIVKATEKLYNTILHTMAMIVGIMICDYFL